MIKIKFILTTLVFFLFVALPIQAAQQNIGALGRIFPKGGIISLSGPPGDTVDLIMAAPENPVLEGTPLMVFASQKKREQEVETAKNNILQTEQKTAIAIALQKQKIDTISKSATDRIALQKMKIEAAQEQKLFAANNLNRLLTAGQASYSTQQKEEREHQQKIAENNLVTASLELEQLNRTRDADLELARLELSRLTADQKISLEQIAEFLGREILPLSQRIGLKNLQRAVHLGHLDVAVSLEGKMAVEASPDQFFEFGIRGEVFERKHRHFLRHISFFEPFRNIGGFFPPEGKG